MFFKKKNTLQRRRTPSKGTHNMFKEESQAISKRNRFRIFAKKLTKHNIKFDTDSNSKKWFILIILVFLLMWFFSFAFKSSYFSLKNPSVLRQDPYVNNDIAYNVVSEFMWENIISLNKNVFAEKIKESQPNIKDVHIKKKYPDWVEIKLYSFDPVYKTTYDNIDYYILENWVFVPIESLEDIKTLNIYNIDLSSYDFLPYTEVISEDNLKKINYLYSWLTLLDPAFLDAELNYFVKNKELHLELWKTFYIFDLVWDLDNKLLAFEVFYNNTKSGNEAYVDLRIKDRYDICPREPKDIYEDAAELEKSCYDRLETIYNYNFQKDDKAN